MKNFESTMKIRLSFFIDNVCIMFDGRVFIQTVAITKVTNCAPFLSDLHINLYEAECIQELLKKNEKKVARSYYLTFRYIDDVLSLDSSGFGNSVDRTNTIMFELIDTTCTARSVSYIDLHIQIDSECWLRTQKR